jgi:hypothetical protein
VREVEPDKQFSDTDVPQELLPLVESTGPSEAERIIITLLMRIYDLQYAQLYVANPTVADEVFESHNRGELGNPKMFIPDFGTEEA